jgi:hypothetical protein
MERRLGVVVYWLTSLNHLPGFSLCFSLCFSLPNRPPHTRKMPMFFGDLGKSAKGAYPALDTPHLFVRAAVRM